MDFSWITIVKYVGLFLTLGTAFIGSWFLEFTTTEKETSRKRFTVWGRRGIVFAAAAAVCTLAATISADQDASAKRKAAAERQKQVEATAEAERENASRFRARSEARLTDIHSMLTAISSTNMTERDQATVQKAVVNLSGIQDYKTYFPELYERIVNARSYDEVVTGTLEGIRRAVNGRVSPGAKCAKIPRETGQKLSGYPGGLFKISNTAAMSYMIQPTGVHLNFTDAHDSNSLDKAGYKLVYADGTESDMVCSRFNSPMSCAAETSNPAVRAIYEQLRVKTVVAIRTKTKLYEVPNTTAMEMQSTFSCISP